MTTIDASALLRAQLLSGVSLLLAGGPEESPYGAAAKRACADLGASVSLLPVQEGHPSEAREQEMTAAVERALTEHARIDVLVVDGAALFGTVSGDPSVSGETDRQAQPRAALRRCLGDTWSVTRAVANVAFIAGERGGRIVYLAPPTGAGMHAEPARAGLENLARTLSVEWARNAITTVAIAPGERTTTDDVAAVVAFLASPAGSYFSGCRLDLRG